MSSDQPNGDDLDRRLEQAQSEMRSKMSKAEGRAESRGWALGIEFIGTVLVSGFLGYLIDGFAGTGPWAMIVLLVLGFIAGTYRASKMSQAFDADPNNDVNG